MGKSGGIVCIEQIRGLCYAEGYPWSRVGGKAIAMVEPLAEVIVNALKLVDLVFSIWVDLEAAELLTTLGSDLVDALAEVAMGVVDIMAQFVLNMTA